ncbi:MAG: TIGR00270 family protein [archaeon]|nr:MAG: TIGR00270 family protein [archaeon]
MTECEICGSNASKRAEIDGALVNVCDGCAKYGKVAPEPVKLKPKPKQEIDSSKYIDPQYPKLIKKAREEKDLKIEELAKKINEKESVISRLETGHLSPSFSLAEKLENFLEIELVKEYEGNLVSQNKEGGSGLTIGDVVEIGGTDD